MKRKVLFILTAFCLTVAACELLLRISSPWWRRAAGVLEPRDFVGSSTKIEKIMRGFDAETGWRHVSKDPSGARKDLPRNRKPWALAFGDSYVFGDEVGDKETWPHYLGKIGEGDVYNFGVGGYGPDQALLYFKKISRTLAAPYAILGLTRENINRIVNIYRPFYLPDTGLPLTKPRFVLRDGKPVLMENPIQRVDGVGQLRDDDFIAKLGTRDVWYAQRMSQSRILRFPYLFEVFKKSFWTGVFGLQGGGDSYREVKINFWKDTETVALLKAIIAEFAVHARSKNIRPLLVLLPHPSDLEAWSQTPVSWRREMLDFCDGIDLRCFDGLEAIQKHSQKTNIPDSDYWLRYGHLSPLGNKVLAEAMRSWMADWEKTEASARGIRDRHR